MAVFLTHAEQGDDTIGKALGDADYSYHFVLKSFHEVLASLGETLDMRDRAEADPGGAGTRSYDVPGQVDAVFALCRLADEPCLFFSFTPPHSTRTDLACPTIPVFAWEFHDLPGETWDEEWRNDWRSVLRSTGRAITHSTFAVAVVRRAMGEDYPVISIPAPVWDRMAGVRAERRERAGEMARQLVLPRPVVDTGSAAKQGPRLAARTLLRFDFSGEMGVPAPSEAPEAEGWQVPLTLDGIVYTAVFNPRDGRKNWEQILHAFCLALGDKADATLLLKLVGPMPFGMKQLAAELERVRPFRCRVIVVEGLLDGATYDRLLGASTYIVNASSGEGQCLPLMEAMSAGVPAIAPDHTAMADYVDRSNAFVVASTLEPCAWPQDPRAKLRTWRHRPDVMSLVHAFRDAHATARDDPGRYAAMSQAAVDALERHCSRRVARENLARFLSLPGVE